MRGKLLTFDSSGDGVVTETLFTDTGIQDPSPATIASTGNLFTAYQNNSASQAGEFAMYTPAGARGFPVSGGEVVEASSAFVICAAAFGNGNALVAYRAQVGANKGKFLVYDEDGALVGGKTTCSTATPTAISATTLSDGNALVAYEENGGPARIMVVDPQGDVVSEPWTFETHVISRLSVTKLKKRQGARGLSRQRRQHRNLPRREVRKSSPGDKPQSSTPVNFACRSSTV